MKSKYELPERRLPSKDFVPKTSQKLPSFNIEEVHRQLDRHQQIREILSNSIQSNPKVNVNQTFTGILKAPSELVNEQPVVKKKRVSTSVTRGSTKMSQVQDNGRKQAHFEKSETPLDKQLMDLKRMNSEISKLKSAQYKTKIDYQQFKLQRQSQTKDMKRRYTANPTFHQDSKSSSQSNIENMAQFQNQVVGDPKADVIHQMLKDRCTQGQLINPAMALKFLNFAQKEEDPEAYEPEFVVQHRKKQEMKMVELGNKADALFDFDDDLDQLSQVSDRYPVNMFKLKPDQLTQQEELDSNMVQTQFQPDTNKSSQNNKSQTDKLFKVPIYRNNSSAQATRNNKPRYDPIRIQSGRLSSMLQRVSLDHITNYQQRIERRQSQMTQGVVSINRQQAAKKLQQKATNLKQSSSFIKQYDEIGRRKRQEFFQSFNEVHANAGKTQKQVDQKQLVYGQYFSEINQNEQLPQFIHIGGPQNKIHNEDEILPIEEHQQQSEIDTSVQPSITKTNGCHLTYDMGQELILRLKKFYNDSIDKKNVILAKKLNCKDESQIDDIQIDTVDFESKKQQKQSVVGLLSRPPSFPFKLQNRQKMFV